MTVGERLKQLREQLGMSQVDFATKINVSKQTLYKYENNIITNIPSDKIESAARICNVSPAYLMGWVSPEQNTLEIIEKPHLSTSDFIVRLPNGSEFTAKNLHELQQIRRLLSYYIALNEIGQKKAMDNLEDLSKIYSVPEAPQPQLNAAHSRTDISDAERTQEAKKAEEDIMDDPNF